MSIHLIRNATRTRMSIHLTPGGHSPPHKWKQSLFCPVGKKASTRMSIHLTFRPFSVVYMTDRPFFVRSSVEQTFASLTTDRQTQHDAVADPVRVLPRRRFCQAVSDPEPIAVARGLRPDNRYIHSTAARSQAHHHLSVGGSEREESQSSITNRLTQGADLSQIFNS